MKTRQNKTRMLVCIFLAASVFAIQAFAESTGQRVLRLRNEAKAGNETAYTRDTTSATDSASTESTGQKVLQLRNQQNTGRQIAYAQTANQNTVSKPIASVKQIEKIAIDASDPLNLVPADALVCVRINNFSDTLQNLDQYLTGVSPMPLSMIATTQIGTILGNPMMSGINFSGNPVFFGRMGPGITEEYIILLLPVTSYKDFIGQHPNASKPDADGIVNLSSPNSPLGPLAAAEAPGGKYAYITMAPAKQMITAAKEALAENKSITNSLEPLETNRSTKSPLWAYGNLDIAVKSFKPMIVSTLQMIQMQADQAATDNPDQLNPEQIKTGMALLQNSLDQLKSLSIALNPKPAKTSISFAFTAKPGTELAKTLVPAPTIGQPFTLAGTLNKPAGMNMLLKINKPLLNSYFDLISKISTNTDSAEIEKISTECISALKDEMAFSLDYETEKLFEFSAFVKIKDDISPGNLIENQIKLAESKLFNSDMKLKYKITTSTYKSNTIYIANTDVPLDPQKKVTIPIQINIAIVDNILYSCSGDVKQLQKLIDRGIPSPSTATGDMKTALNLIDNPQDYELIASYNMIRLMSGIGKMQSKITSAQEQEMPKFFEGINTESQSCAAVTGKIYNGSACMDLILPKAHLMEVYQAVMQIQQKMMQQMMQGQGTQPDMLMMEME